MRDLSCQPWCLRAEGPNVVRYQVLSRTRVDPRHLEWWGERSHRQILQRYFDDAAHDMGSCASTIAADIGASLPCGALGGTLHRRPRITHLAWFAGGCGICNARCMHCDPISRLKRADMEATSMVYSSRSGLRCPNGPSL
jgi:hypothetical protein